MCLAFLLRSIVPGIPTILLFNRDEDFERNSLPIHRWQEHPQVFGGFDAATGGTWAGVTSGGRFGMLTFVREPRLAMTPSKRRGEILRNFLIGNEPIESFANQLAENAKSYLGYNVIFGDAQDCLHFNNRSGALPQKLGTGLFGLSNADLDTPWFKVTRGKEFIREALRTNGADVEAYFRILNDRLVPPDEEVQQTGLAFEREKSKSPLFVSEADYGTRSSSVVLFHASGEIDFFERSYRQEGKEHLQVHLQIKKG